MKEFLCESSFFGIALSLAGYEIGIFLKNKFPYSFLLCLHAPVLKLPDF